MKRSNTRKTKEESIKDFQEKLNLGYNFVDYFLTIGVNPDIFKNQWLYESSIDELNSIYKEHLMPKIINKFPSFGKKYVGLDDTIIYHCFPLGFKVHEFTYERPPNKIFSILLDNNNYSTTLPFKYVVCLLFYESINDYRKLYEKYYNNAFINTNNFKKNKNMNNSVFLESNDLFTFSDTMSNLSYNTYNNNLHNNLLNNNSILSNNSPVSDFTQKETNFSSFLNNKNYGKYYIPKCICLISLYPFVIELTKIINSIYKYSQKEKIEIPLEKIINNLILEVPAPPRGLYSIEYSLFDKTFLLQNSRMNNLYFATIEINKLFMVFNAEQVLKIFQYLMLGIKIVFFSSKIEFLTPIIFSSLMLLFPFKFPFPVVSILPKEAYNLIDNITPEVLGVNEKYYYSFFTDNDIDITDHLLIVDIDGQVIIPIKSKNNDELPSLPKKLKVELIEKINNYINSIHEKSKNHKKESIKMFQYVIRNFFLEFQTKLMKNYTSYLNSNIYKHPSEKPFKVKKFLSSVSSKDYSFYEKFIETQMFNDYILKRMTPKDKEGQSEVLYFEEKIFHLKDKENKTIFLNSNLFDFNNKYKVPKITPLKSKLLEFYNNENNYKKLLLDGILMDNSNIKEISKKKDIDYINKNNLIFNNNENKPIFNYIIFPKLNNDLFFENDIKSYFLDLSIFNEIKNINSELISKSHLSRVETQTNEITNFAYILWLKVWAHSFYYHDKIEQKYRYFQMIKVFNKVNQHEMSVISHLFQALIKANADEDLIFHLYIKILQCNLSPSIDIFNTIKNIIRKKTKNSNMPSSEISKFLLNKEKLPIYKQDLNKKNFRKRTMKNIYDFYMIKEKVTFFMEETCNNCDRKIDIYYFQKNINDTNNDIVWAKCPFCKSPYLPKLKVIFGDEINKNGKLKKCTSIVDEVILYSPKTLEMNFFDNSNIDIDNLKLNYNPVFWNLIWYFKINKLPFDFILPYNDNIFGAKKKRIQNIFKVKFSHSSENIKQISQKPNNSINNLKLKNIFNINNQTPIIHTYKENIPYSKSNSNTILKFRINKDFKNNNDNNIENKLYMNNIMLYNKDNNKIYPTNKVIKLNIKPNYYRNNTVKNISNNNLKNLSFSYNNYNKNNIIIFNNNYINSHRNIGERVFYQRKDLSPLKPLNTQITNTVKFVNDNSQFINNYINYRPNNNFSYNNSYDYGLNNQYYYLNYNNINMPRHTTSLSSFIIK